MRVDGSGWEYHCGPWIPPCTRTYIFCRRTSTVRAACDITQTVSEISKILNFTHTPPTFNFRFRHHITLHFPIEKHVHILQGVSLTGLLRKYAFVIYFMFMVWIEAIFSPVNPSKLYHTCQSIHILYNRACRIHRRYCEVLLPSILSLK